MNINSFTEELVETTRTHAPANRKERDRLIRRSDIFRAAERVFASKGFHRATIQDIAKEAQYAVGTVYLYFKDKGELYFSLVEEKMKFLLSVTRERAERAKDARAKLEIVIREHLDFFEKNRDFFRIFLFEESHSSIEARASKSAVALRHREYIIELIRFAQHQKVIRDDLSAKKIAEIFGALFHTVIHERFSDEVKQHHDAGAVAAFVLDMFLHGVGKK